MLVDNHCVISTMSRIYNIMFQFRENYADNTFLFFEYRKRKIIIFTILLYSRDAGSHHFYQSSIIALVGYIRIA